jgi:hypothetical protein
MEKEIQKEVPKEVLEYMSTEQLAGLLQNDDFKEQRPMIYGYYVNKVSKEINDRGIIKL